MCTVEGDVEPIYQDVRSESSSTNWLICDYKDNTTVGLKSSGDGGVDELRDNLDDAEVAYGYVKIDYEEEGTNRTKFCLIHWTGENASVLRKAKVSVHKGNVKEVIRDFSIELQCSEKDELSAEQVEKTVRKANY